MEVNNPAIYVAGPYAVYTGRMQADTPLRYLVVHNEHQVCEYETDVLAAAIAWAKHFNEELIKLLNGEKSVTGDVVGQNVLPFGRPN